MNSGLIGKIEKAKRYATKERHRIHFSELSVRFDGANGEHDVTLHEGAWLCTCEFFAGWGLCGHSMALERILEEMLPVGARHQEQMAKVSR